METGDGQSAGRANRYDLLGYQELRRGGHLRRCRHLGAGCAGGRCRLLAGVRSGQTRQFRRATRPLAVTARSHNSLLRAGLAVLAFRFRHTLVRPAVLRTARLESTPQSLPLGLPFYLGDGRSRWNRLGTGALPPLPGRRPVFTWAWPLPHFVQSIDLPLLIPLRRFRACRHPGRGHFLFPSRPLR